MVRSKGVISQSIKDYHKEGVWGSNNLHENYSEGMKDVFKQEIHKKGDESGAIVLLNTK